MPNTNPHLEEAWQSEALKSGGPSMVAVIRYLKDTQEDFLKTLEANTQLCKQIEARMESFLDSFPGRDAVGHRRYHDAVIEHLEWKKLFYRDLIAHMAKWGLGGIALFLIGCIGLGIKKWWMS